ncbi:MAG: hypothetical protein ABW252_24210 [Polyangiales bacterium]
MTISAIALLRVSLDSLPEAVRARATALDDGILLPTDAAFATDPEELSITVRALVGPALEDEHRDARGIFLIPDVVSPSGKSYEAVIDEIGEGGVWGPLVDALDTPEGADAFKSMLGGLLEHLPGSLLAAANAAAQGQPGAFEAMSQQLSGMLGGNPALAQLLSSQGDALLGPALQALTGAPPAPDGEEDTEYDDEDVSVGQDTTFGETDSGPVGDKSAIGEMAELAALLGGAGFQLDSPQFQQLARNVQAEIERDPSAVAQLAEQLMAGYPHDASRDRDE